MNHFPYLFLSILLMQCSEQKTENRFPLPSGSGQLILVVTPDAEATEGELFRFEKTVGGSWKKVAEPHVVTVGRSGLAWGKGMHPEQPGQQKKEGDGKAPSGIFRLTKIFGYEPPLDLTLKMPFVRADEVLECVDDSHSKFYNQLVDSLSQPKDWASGEFMRRQDHQYKWGVVVEHNAGAVPQGGSCIFLHIWKEPGAPTSGCTAMRESDLLPLLYWLDEKNAPVMVQLTAAEYAGFGLSETLPRG